MADAGRGRGSTESTEKLLRIAGDLYSGLPGDFTARRDRAERSARAEGDKELGLAVKALRKPSVAAWAVNLLVRREATQIEEVLGLAGSLRSAAEALDGGELRALTKQRRALTNALTTRAAQLALECGSRLTRPVSEQVEDTLTAAMLDPGAAEAVRSGLLVRALSSTGLDPQDAGARADAVALPEALGTRAAPVENHGESGPALHVVPPNRAVLREAARDRLAAAQHDHDAARREARRTDRAANDLQGRRLQLGNEIDELERRLAEAGSDLEDLDDEIEAADEANAEAGDRLARTERDRDEAQDELDSL